MGKSLTFLSVVGARPQFVKLAPIARAFAQYQECSHQIIHTGQHYDDRMSASFFDQLEIPKPDIDLAVGSGGHGVQTAGMLTRLEEHLLQGKQDAVLTYGDTNSTLAATLAASKLHIPVAHIEAGLRSFNRDMPEEINRLVADHCSDRLYAPTPTAMQNLANENLSDRSVVTGDVMLDAINHNIKLANEKSTALTEHGLTRNAFALVTIHRPVNTTGSALDQLLAALEKVAKSVMPLIFPIHPRTKTVLDELNYVPGPNLRIVDPAPYLDIITLIEGAAVVITDSGGMQKEAAFLKTPCLTMRDETEWTETVDLGVNKLVGNSGSNLVEMMSSLKKSDLVFTDNVCRQLEKNYGNGKAAELIVSDCLDWLS